MLTVQVSLSWKINLQSGVGWLKAGFHIINSEKANSQTIAVLFSLSTDIMYYLFFITLLFICYLSFCIKKWEAEKWIRKFPTLKMFPSSGRNNQILKNYNMFYSSYKKTYNCLRVKYKSQAEGAANSCYIPRIHSSFSEINTFPWLESCSINPSSPSSHFLPSPPQRWACNEGKAQHNVPSSWSQWLVQD